MVSMLALGNGPRSRRAGIDQEELLDLQILCIFIITGAALMMLLRAIVTAGKPKIPSPRNIIGKSVADSVGLDDALDKLNETVRILQHNLGDEAPGRHDPHGARFYIAYMIGVTRQVAVMNQIAYGPAIETPVRMEMIRLGIRGGSHDEAMAMLLASDEGQQGLIAGEMDGADACDRNYNGPYFARILSYFTDAQVRGPR